MQPESAVRLAAASSATPLGKVHLQCVAQTRGKSHPSRLRRLEVHDFVVGNAQSPGEEVRARLEFVEPLPQHQACFLKEILRIVPIQQQGIDVGQHLTRVESEQTDEFFVAI